MSHVGGVESRVDVAPVDILILLLLGLEMLLVLAALALPGYQGRHIVLPHLQVIASSPTVVVIVVVAGG